MSSSSAAYAVCWGVYRWRDRGNVATGQPQLVVKGYQAAITQLGVGIGVNWLAEFAPEIKRILHIEKN